MHNLRESRSKDQLRPIRFECGINPYAEGSALIEIGKTKVLCTVSVQESLPSWRVPQKKGWLTAEYSMLPRATHTRNSRERSGARGRTQEIERLIARALRSMLNLEHLGERTLMVDCDVLTADGGTRCASITGACLAVCHALHGLIETQKVKALVFKDFVNAVSIGIKDGDYLVDLNYEEDSQCDTDSNFVMLGQGSLVEVQAAAESGSYKAEALVAMMKLALQANETLTQLQKDALTSKGISFFKNVPGG